MNKILQTIRDWLFRLRTRTLGRPRPPAGMRRRQTWRDRWAVWADTVMAQWTSGELDNSGLFDELEARWQRGSVPSCPNCDGETEFTGRAVAGRSPAVPEVKCRFCSYRGAGVLTRVLARSRPPRPTPKPKPEPPRPDPDLVNDTFGRDRDV